MSIGEAKWTSVTFSCSGLTLYNNMHTKLSTLASELVSGGFSGAELISICREAALLAIEEEDENPLEIISPSIGMQHLMRAVGEMQRQITPNMLEFYASYARVSSTH